MRKFKDWEWDLGKDGHICTWEEVSISVMMDVRDELKKLNALLHCSNFVAIPDMLRNIRRHTSRLPVKRKAARKKK